MFSDALQTYSIVVRNKQYPQAGRLRVNMGNIFYRQEKYPAAIKMYRMAMDQVGSASKETRFFFAVCGCGCDGGGGGGFFFSWRNFDIHPHQKQNN